MLILPLVVSYTHTASIPADNINVFQIQFQNELMDIPDESDGLSAQSHQLFPFPQDLNSQHANLDQEMKQSPWFEDHPTNLQHEDVTPIGPSRSFLRSDCLLNKDSTQKDAKIDQKPANPFLKSHKDSFEKNFDNRSDTLDSLLNNIEYEHSALQSRALNSLLVLFRNTLLISNQISQEIYNFKKNYSEKMRNDTNPLFNPYRSPDSPSNRLDFRKHAPFSYQPQNTSYSSSVSDQTSLDATYSDRYLRKVPSATGISDDIFVKSISSSTTSNGENDTTNIPSQTEQSTHQTFRKDHQQRNSYETQDLSFSTSKQNENRTHDTKKDASDEEQRHSASEQCMSEAATDVPIFQNPILEDNLVGYGANQEFFTEVFPEVQDQYLTVFDSALIELPCVPDQTLNSITEDGDVVDTDHVYGLMEKIDNSAQIEESHDSNQTHLPIVKEENQTEQRHSPFVYDSFDETIHGDQKIEHKFTKKVSIPHQQIVSESENSELTNLKRISTISNIAEAASECAELLLTDQQNPVVKAIDNSSNDSRDSFTEDRPELKTVQSRSSDKNEENSFDVGYLTDFEEYSTSSSETREFEELEKKLEIIFKSKYNKFCPENFLPEIPEEHSSQISGDSICFSEIDSKDEKISERTENIDQNSEDSLERIEQTKEAPVFPGLEPPIEENLTDKTPNGVGVKVGDEILNILTKNEQSANDQESKDENRENTSGSDVPIEINNEESPAIEVMRDLVDKSDGQYEFSIQNPWVSVL